MGRSKKKKKGGGGCPPAPASAVGVNEKMLRQLEGMGFDTPSCRRALLLSDNNLQVALENLEIAPAPAPAPVPAPAAAAASVTTDVVPAAAATVAAHASAPAAASGEVVDEGWTFRPVKPKKKKKDHSKERNWSNFVSADEMERLARYDAITASVANIGGDGGDGSSSSLPQAEIDAIAATLGGGGSGGGGAAGAAGGDDDARMLRDQWADEKARLQAQVRRQAEQIHALTTKLAADNDIIVASLAFAGGGDAAALAAAKASALALKSKAPAPAPKPKPKPKPEPKPEPEPEAAKAAASPPAPGDAAAREVLKRYHAQFSKQLKKYFADKARLEQRIVALTGENTDLRKKLEMGNKAVVAQLLQEQATHQEALAAKDSEIKRLKSMVNGTVGEADAEELSQLSKEALATRLFPLVACERPDQAVQITDLLKERMSKEELVKLLSDASSREDLQRKIEEFSPTQVLGERLYPLVWKQLQGGGERDPGAAARKVTGMLLAGVEDAELRQMLTDRAALAAKVNEALTLLATQGE